MVRFPVPKADLQTAAQVARLGNLLNQAVALAHRGSAPAWPSQEMTEPKPLWASRCSTRRSAIWNLLDERAFLI